MARTLFVMLWMVAEGGAAPSDRPNLVAIVTDDQGQWAVGAYGNREIHTPHIDRLAKEGAMFRNAFAVTPVCSPSRAAYMTGRWPTQLGITDWIDPGESRRGLGLSAPIWVAALQRQGYRTGLFGKWHLGVLPEFHPTRKGFESFTGFLSGGTTPKNALLEIAGQKTQTEGFVVDVITDHALRFLAANRPGPFALCIHYREPHLPYQPVPEQDRRVYDNLDPTIPNWPGLDQAKVKAQTRAYYASISAVDRNVGRILAALEAQGLADNTVVIFTSDHGYNEGRHGVDTKGNGRWIAGGVIGPTRPNMWDTSLKIPLLVRWPKEIKAGVRLDEFYSNLDTYRTYLGLLGVEAPAEVGGIDWSKRLRGGAAIPRDRIFGQYDLHHYGLAYMRMVRTRHYKFIRYFHANGLDELYDLRQDPEERVNLYTQRGQLPSGVLAELVNSLRRWQESIDDPILKDPY